MAFNVGNCVVVDSNRNVNAGIGTFTSLNVPPIPITFSPSDGATGVLLDATISITFNQSIIKNTGNITLRNGSAVGTVLQTINVTSGNVVVSGSQVTITPSPALSASTDIYVVIPAGTFVSQSFNNNIAAIDTYNFTTQAATVGSALLGGTLICKASNIYWISAPSGSQVSRAWASRGDANTTAQQVSGCTGWFVPTLAQYQNPGFTCRAQWSPTNAFYWSNTECNSIFAFCINPVTNASTGFAYKGGAANVRSFRCVTY
jgi:hypothetical protein